MGDRRILGGGVTLRTDAVGRSAELAGMRLVTVAAGDTGREHLALLERAVVVDLVPHLPVCVIKALAYWRDHMRLGQPSARTPCFGELATASMAETAGLDLRPQSARRAAANSIAGRGSYRPGRITSFGQALGETHGRIVGRSERPPALPFARPGDVTRALAVTGLATDTDLGKGGGKAVVRGIVVLADTRRVALRAQRVPILVQLGPMQ